MFSCNCSNLSPRRDFLCAGAAHMLPLMTRLPSLLAAAALCLAAHGTAPAAAQVVESVDSVVSVTMLDGWREPDGTHIAGIKITLAPGWKTYWRAPGDGGIPTSASWAGSRNLADVRVHWPRPQVFRTFGLRSVGYADQVVLPVHLAPETRGDIDARLSLRLGVCNEICLPVDVALQARLSEGKTEGAAYIKSALADQPRPHDARLSCTLTQRDDEYWLEVVTNLPPPDGLAETSVIELADRRIWVSEPRFMRDDNWVISQVRLVPQSPVAKPDLSTLRMTLLTTTEAVELEGCD